MKKTATFSIAALSIITASAQLPVSHTAGKKQVLIEEFTGHTCPNCPDGHSVSDQITSGNPGKAFSINMHATGLGFTNPTSASNSLDLRVPESLDVLLVPGVLTSTSTTNIGLPGATINRMAPISPAQEQYPGQGGRIISRSYWPNMSTAILAQNSYVNIAGQAYLHPTTRQLMVNMEAYYTANSPVASNRIVIALVQDDIIAYQSGSSGYPSMVVGNGYRHNHALRDFINGGTNNGARGEVMTGSNTIGTTWTKSFSYTVAAYYPTAATTKTIAAVLADLELIAYITEGDKDIVAVCKVPITITTSTAIFNPTNAKEVVNFVNVYPSPMMNEGALVFTLNESAPVVVEIVNALGQIVFSDNLKTLEMGEHKYKLDASTLKSGVYFVNLKVNTNTTTKKITVIK